MKYITFLFAFIGIFAQNLNKFKKDIKTLSGKEFYGRGFVKNGHLKAANYVQKRFAEAGLAPAPSLGSYFQDFTVEAYVIKNAECVINNKTLKIGTQYIPHYASGNYCEVSAKAIYVKSGIPKYYPKNTQGKIIIISTTQKIPDKYSNFKKINKRINYAIERGASAVVLLEKKPVHSIIANHYIEPYQVPVIRIFEDSVKIRRKQQMNICVEANWHKIETQNVMGFHHGKTDTTIIIGAHYDHLGTIYDKFGADSAVFCGANDNASGTSLLISLADTIAKINTKYSVLFIAFGSEEAGLLGSRYYVQNPVIPLPKTKFMINLDLWGFGKNGYVVVAGEEFPYLYNKLKKYTEELNDSTFKISKRKNAPNSDHYFFIKAGVPAVFLYNKGGKFYHDVWDTYETLTFAGFPKIYTVLVKLIKNP